MMKAKYITAENLEAAENTAAEHFGLNKGEITIEVLSEDAQGAVCEVLALVGSPGEISNMNAGFGVYYEPGGVFLEVYEQRGAGKPLVDSDLMQYLSRKNLSGVNVTPIHKLLSAKQGRSAIAPAQSEFLFGEDLKVEVSADEMEASARLLSPEPGGSALELGEAKQKIVAAGVTHCIDEQAIIELLAEKCYNEPKIIASGLPPEDGQDGTIVFNFSTDERTGRPREIGGGRVDYRSLDLYEPVTEGQLLLSKEPATEGKPGTSVKGREIKQKPGKEAALPRGKNVTINNEKTQMHANCSGMVQFLNNAVNVSNVYTVKGDCDLSVGNIDFDGCVHISGSVRSGNTIKATGSVVVGGVVEAAKISAKGNIEIKSGMQGSDKGMIEAGGSVVAMYIERGHVVADGSVTVDVSIHSTIETGGTLTAKGKRGAIIGGRVGAAGDVVANYIGAISNTRTEVTVGMMIRKRERISFLEKELERVKLELVKLDQLDVYLAKAKEKMDPEQWKTLNASGMETRRSSMEDAEAFELEKEGLLKELEQATAGKVHVFETAFSGAIISVGSATLKLTDEIPFATFKFREGEVVYGPCEISKQKE
ncbi:MAG: FapA family protein [Oscillospiraceae bacterium]|nr:FapA family protein [Oscillospiraceae bacterium]